MEQDLMVLHASLTKADHDQHIVEGYISTSETIDRDNQVMDSNFLREKIPPWLTKYGNVRLQHRPEPIGKIVSSKPWDGKGFYVSAKITDSRAWDMVKSGVLNSFSIGIKNAKIVRDDRASGGRIVDGEPIEVSLCDIGSNPDCDIMTIKSASYDPSSAEWLEGEQVEKGVTDAHHTPPEGYPHDASQYGDPTNHKYPIDKDHIRAAVEYFNHPGECEKGGYSESEWAEIGRRIAHAAKESEGGDYKFEDGKIVTPSDDTNKDVGLDSGLQGPNLEGQKEDKSTMAADAKCKECGTELEDDKCPKCADADVKKEAGVSDMNSVEGLGEYIAKSTSVLDLVLSRLEDIQGQINALASQTDGDKDGDIDTTSDEEDKGDAAKEGDIEDDVTGKSVEADVTFTDAQLEVVKSLIAESVNAALAQSADVSKSLVADETKSLVADVTKRVDEAFQSLDVIGQRLEVVEQSAAPAKGAVMERDGGTVNKTTQTAAELWSLLSQQAKQADDQTQTQAFATVYKSTIPTGGQI